MRQNLKEYLVHLLVHALNYLFYFALKAWLRNPDTRSEWQTRPRMVKEPMLFNQTHALGGATESNLRLGRALQPNSQISFAFYRRKTLKKAKMQAPQSAHSLWIFLQETHLALEMTDVKTFWMQTNSMFDPVWVLSLLFLLLSIPRFATFSKAVFSLFR